MAVIDEGTATLVAAIIAAIASTVTSLLIAIPPLLRTRRRQKRLIELLSGNYVVRSIEWLSRRLGVSEAEVQAMLTDIRAHGVLMADDQAGAALDSRHHGD
jgi:biotin operon repressor